MAATAPHASSRAAGQDAERAGSDRELELRQLALVDRIIGLEAEVARLTIIAQRPRAHEVARVHELEAELHSIYESRVWHTAVRLQRPLKSIRRLLSR